MITNVQKQDISICISFEIEFDGYNLDLGLFFYFKWFEVYSGLKVIAFYFQSYRNAKKKKNL